MAAGGDSRGTAAAVRCSDSPAQLLAVVRDARAHVHAEHLSRGREERGKKAAWIGVREQPPRARVRGYGTSMVRDCIGQVGNVGKEVRCGSLAPFWACNKVRDSREPRRLHMPPEGPQGSN